MVSLEPPCVPNKTTLFMARAIMVAASSGRSILAPRAKSTAAAVNI